MVHPRIDQIDILAPNFKLRLSGVTSTIVRLVPRQADHARIAAVGVGLPAAVPRVPLTALLTMSRKGPSGWRVWHARRNNEMLAGIALKFLLGKRLKLLFTSASQRHHTRYTKWLINHMDHVIATSQKTAAFLNRPATVILHGIDVEGFRPSPDRAALKSALGFGNGPLIGCYGRIRPSKGTDRFVDAMIDLLPQHKTAEAVILGRATDRHKDYLKDLKTRIAAAGLTRRVHFPTEVATHEIIPYYQALDLFVAPQRYEGFGLTPLEAMACGVPVVATRAGAFEELILDGKTGHLVGIDDKAGLKSKIDHLLQDAPLRAKMGAAARAHMVDHFSLDHEAEAIINVYQRLLAKA
ncbi:glycosyltransferase family 4 protein [Rhodobacteraceae bacterium XHP0102]|nr:glycosyltransferase family 4 protein [Rhodobacteraceae bacterium XHP0102]